MIWILKGTVLGLGLFVVGTIIYLVLAIRATGAASTGGTVISAMTIQNPYCWAAFIAALVIGCALVGS